MSERNPDSGQAVRESIAVTSLRNIASGHWNAGRGDLTISVEQYASEALAAMHFEEATWRSRYLGLMDDVDAARRARG